VELVPLGVPGWAAAPRREGRVFTVGFAGRLVPQKGILDLVDACRLVPGPLRLLVVGDGPLRSALEALTLHDAEIALVSGLSHDRMPEEYAEMDVLVLPSRTTEKWAEQFGRVLVEALSCGVPVVGSSSGEIPWVIEATGGGLIFPEGDVEALARIIGELRADPERRAELARTGAEGVRRHFSVDAAVGALESALMAAAVKGVRGER
jgi:glycosyltransferase involved in cell wall biosynthesis